MSVLIHAQLLLHSLESNNNNNNNEKLIDRAHDVVACENHDYEKCLYSVFGTSQCQHEQPQGCGAPPPPLESLACVNSLALMAKCEDSK